MTERDHDRVLLYDEDGVFLHCFGSCGKEVGQLSHPRQVAISPTGDIYICDTDNKRIQIYSA